MTTSASSAAQGSGEVGDGAGAAGEGVKLRRAGGGRDGGGGGSGNEADQGKVDEESSQPQMSRDSTGGELPAGGGRREGAGEGVKSSVRKSASEAMTHGSGTSADHVSGPPNAP